MARIINVTDLEVVLDGELSECLEHFRNLRAELEERAEEGQSIVYRESGDTCGLLRLMSPQPVRDAELCIGDAAFCIQEYELEY